MSIWVCGEVLVDLLPSGAVIGGGPANTAKALARLGQTVEFIGGISTDSFGEMATKELVEDGVGLRHALRSGEPTCTAEVTLASTGTASYRFNTDGTATFDFGSWLPDPYKFKPEILHIGTLATVILPGADFLFQWALGVSELAPIVFDPNIRPSVLPNHKKYLESVEKWVGISSVVKLSDEDLVWLYPNVDPLQAAQKWINEGVALVVITKGEGGIVGARREEAIAVESFNVKVVDTVGAGDTVGAVLVEAIVERGLANLCGEVLRGILSRAALAASITCSRAGANPPTKKELTRALEVRV